MAKTKTMFVPAVCWPIPAQVEMMREQAVKGLALVVSGIPRASWPPSIELHQGARACLARLDELCDHEDLIAASQGERAFITDAGDFAVLIVAMSEVPA